MATDPSFPDPADVTTETAQVRYARTLEELRDAEAEVATAQEDDELLQFDPTRFERTRTHIPNARATREHVNPETGTTVIDSGDREQPLA